MSYAHQYPMVAGIAVREILFISQASAIFYSTELWLFIIESHLKEHMNKDSEPKENAKPISAIIYFQLMIS